jgi:hypothetical protein
LCCHKESYLQVLTLAINNNSSSIETIIKALEKKESFLFQYVYIGLICQVNPTSRFNVEF